MLVFTMSKRKIRLRKAKAKEYDLKHSLLEAGLPCILEGVQSDRCGVFWIENVVCSIHTRMLTSSIVDHKCSSTWRELHTHV